MDFDTHAAVKRLAQTGLTEAQAEALVDALRALSQGQRADLATKSDLRMEIASLRAELLKWMFGIAVAQIVLIVTLVKLL